ncbi:MAG TPA: carboxylesterase family protein, partial [Ohtaekwangia sp.]
MKYIFTIALTCLIIITQAQLKTVKTENGTVSGLQQNEVSIFKGIPFAAPPIGELRWKAPQPVKNWSGTRKCETFPASPIQSNPVPFLMWSEEFITPQQPLSEDCLYLNIWTAAKSAKEKRPVFVWIHGGGFVSGSGACPIYDGEKMAKNGIVYVSINYRLGVFGFLAHPELSKESGENASGNYAILDQIAALQWIKKNIAAFGGDPEQVTIAGQSAGSFCVNALVASPLAKDLFQRAIAQSGSFVANGFGRSLESAETTGKTFVQNANATSIAELRKKSADDIFKAAQTLPYGSFSPVFEDYTLPSQPLTFFRAGKQNNVPLLTGWVTGDASLRGNP